VSPATSAAKGLPPISGATVAARADRRSVEGAAAAKGLAYHYVYVQSDDVGLGAKGDYLVADPVTAPGDSHSLSELAVQSADGQQIVEEGWTVDPGQFGDRRPHLFVFHWVNHVPGCYDACGFVSTSATTVPGMRLKVGTVQRFKIRYVHRTRDWTIYLDGDEVGYFPGSLWSGKFFNVGLTQWFGEVASNNHPPCATMGNGLPAADAAADSITHMNLVSGAKQNDLEPADTNRSLYSGIATSGNSVRLGGPGGCATKPQSVVFRSVAPTDAAVGGATYQLSAKGGKSANAVVFAPSKAAAAVCTVTGSTVTFVAVGTCVVDAAQPGNTTYRPSAQVRQSFVVRLMQKIAFTSVPPNPATVGGTYAPAIQLGASGEPAAVTVGTTSASVCAIASGVVTFTGVGVCVLHANQAGNKTYAPSAQVTQTIQVTP
jgi:hypothetical protein